ncbi:MAG: hypothetical protein FJX66_08865 [Alphaproteobacteria bacterium]|nr:hypothetical protein [Alphaproteobacteria bacterium]
MLTWLGTKLLKWFLKRKLEEAGANKWLKNAAGATGLTWSGGAVAGGVLSGLRSEWADTVLSVVVPFYGAVTSIIKAF